ncbi:mCG57115, partial [Mus musculus]
LLLRRSLTFRARADLRHCPPHGRHLDSPCSRAVTVEPSRLRGQRSHRLLLRTGKELWTLPGGFLWVKLSLNPLKKSEDGLWSAFFLDTYDRNLGIAYVTTDHASLVGAVGSWR